MTYSTIQRVAVLRRFGSAACTSFAVGLWILSTGGALAQADLPAQALAQIEAAQDLKRSMSAPERKMSTALVIELRRRRGDAALNRLPGLRSGAEVSPAGTVLVDIDATVSGDLLSAIEAYRGAAVINHFAQFNAIRAEVPLEALESLAARDDVRHIRPAARAMTHMVDVSEGDRRHRADHARLVYGASGGGVKTCALSDGVDSLAAVQASGDLPAVTVLPGQAGAGSEGTAMLEIIHDLAPGSSLSFATGFLGEASFAANIMALAASGCDVIVDDVFYFAEPVFQDGIIAQAVDAVAAAGTVYVSAAGNAGNLNDGTAGVWEGDWVDGGSPPVPDVGPEPDGLAHDWGGGDVTNLVTADGIAYGLQWSDPWGASENDYDLYIFDNALSEVVVASIEFQTGTQNPIEFVEEVFATEQVVVTQFSGDTRYLHLNTFRGQLEHATDGQIAGHAAAQGAIAVAAVNQSEAGDGSFKFPEMPPVAAETFTSDGPRKMFYTPWGQPITADVTASGGLERLKPDLAAADDVMTATPGFNPFPGTSAAAPHVAGVAAILKSVDPGLTGPQIRHALETTAIDIEAPGWDRDTGHGIVDALDAANDLGVPALVTCGGKPPTILGDDSANTLAGTSGSDVIMGFGGGDDISAGRGDDYVCGGNGSDTIDGGKGNDLLLGENGKDEITGKGGGDDIDGGGGNDVIAGGGGTDTVKGGRGKKDKLKGNGGNDALTDKKAKKFNGGGGKDVCVGKGPKTKCEA